MHTLTVRPSTQLGDAPEMSEGAKEHARRGLGSDNTKRAIRSDWLTFEAWCEANGRQPFAYKPADAAPLIADYLTHLESQGRKLATIERALSSITKLYTMADHPNPRKLPAVVLVMDGIRRKVTRQQDHKAPVMVEDLRRMVHTLPGTLAGTRDRALLLLGFAGALRRSELCALTVDDVQETADGLQVRIRKSKTDQHGEGHMVGVPFGSDPATCPVRAFRAWIAAAGITAGPIFRGVNRHNQVGKGALSSDVVADVVKRTAQAAGLDPARFAGHSLRAGLATTAAKHGKGERAIMNQGRWKSVTMARRYIRMGTLFEDNAAAGIGL